MRYRLRPLVATSLVGVGSLITLALSVATMKVLALVVGPDGIGVLALLQSLLNIGVLLTSFGLQASAITLVAAVHQNRGFGPAASAGKTAVALSLVGSGVGAMVLLVFREPIALTMLGTVERSGDLLVVAPALVLWVLATVCAAVLAGLHQLQVLTAVNLGAAFVSSTVLVLLVLALGVNGFAAGLTIGAAVHMLIAGYALVKVAGEAWSFAWSPRLVVRDLLSLGIPVALSQTVTSGALFVLPVVVLHVLGSTEVGLYRAAVAVSLGIGSFFLAGIHQDFLPRMASEHDQGERGALIERRMRLVVGMGIPPILALLACAPVVIDLLYSSEFRPAIVTLEWQLIGDLIRLPAMVLSVAVLAMRSRAAYFGVEAVGGVVLVVLALAATGALGLRGPGVAYAAAALTSLLIAWGVLSRTLDHRPGRLQLMVMGTAACSAIIVSVDLGSVAKLGIFGAAAVVTAMVAWPRLLRLHRQGAL